MCVRSICEEGESLIIVDVCGGNTQWEPLSAIGSSDSPTVFLLSSTETNSKRFNNRGSDLTNLRRLNLYPESRKWVIFEARFFHFKGGVDKEWNGPQFRISDGFVEWELILSFIAGDDFKDIYFQGVNKFISNMRCNGYKSNEIKSCSIGSNK